MIEKERHWIKFERKGTD